MLALFDKTAVICSVNTPTKTRGVGAGKAADLTYWEGAARMIASVSTSSKIVVEKSTVPVKTAEAIEKVLPSLHASKSKDCRGQKHSQIWDGSATQGVLYTVAG